jgi:Prophage antirepressor
MNEIVPIVDLSEPPKQGMFTLMESVFHGHKVRVLRDDRGEPWFVAADLCKVLNIKSASDAVKRLKSNNVQVIDLFDKVSNRAFKINGLAKDPVNIVSEAGMFFFVLRSDKPEAVEFQDWVTGEVLPSIRKTGAYFDPSAAPVAPVVTKERRKRVETSRQIIDAGKRPVLGFEKIYIDNAVRAALESVPVDLKVSVAMRVRRDIRLMAGNVKANELLIVEKNNKEAGIDDGIRTIKSILAMIPFLAKEYETLLPPLLSRKVGKKALPSEPKKLAVVRTLEFAHQGGFTARIDGGPSIAPLRIVIGGEAVRIDRGWHRALGVERDIGAWSDLKYHIFHSSFGRAAKLADIPPDHIRPYSCKDAGGNEREGFEYTPEAVACVLKHAHQLGYLTTPKPVKSMSGDLFEQV